MGIDAVTDRARRLWYIALICAIASVPVVASLFNIATPLFAYGKFGFAARGDGAITYVLPASAAAAAGLKPGDRLNVAALSPQERVYLHWPLTLAGRKAEFILRGGPSRAITLVARPRTWVTLEKIKYFAAFYLLALSNIAIVLIAAALALLRPSRMMWAFLLYAAGTQAGSPILTALFSPAWVVVFSAYCGVVWFGASCALIVFALRFPSDRVRGAGAIADRWLPWLAVAVAPFIVAANIALIYRGADTDPFENFLTILTSALYCLAVIVFVFRYFTEGRAGRPRMAWVIASLLVGFAGIVALRICDSAGVPVSSTVYNLLLATNVVVPIAVAYAIKQRVISVQFFINRALIFAMLVGIAIGGIVLLDWSLARRLEETFSGGGTAAIAAVNVVAALVLGFSMPWLYETLRSLVDRYFFTRQYRAQQRVLELAERLVHADSHQMIDEALVRSVAGDLEIGSVAVFARDGNGSFRREAAKGWGDNHVLEHLDTERLAAAFESANGALRFKDLQLASQEVPTGDAAPAVGLPIFVAGKLSRFVLFSGHPYGLDLDPSEKRLLGTVTRAASHGLARLSQL